MPTGLVSTYDLTVGVMLDVEDMIHLLDPFDVPMLGMFGVDGRPTISKDTCFEKKVEWLDEELLTPRDLLNGAVTSTATFITVDERLKFTTGDVLLINSEYLRVTDYGTTANTLVVDRGYGSSDAAAHSDNDDVVGVGTALAEGGDPKDARSKDRTNRHNFTQIFGPHKVEVSRSENSVRKYGLRGTTEMDHQIANRIKEVGVAIEQAIWYGERNEDTTNEFRTMGGMKFYITTHIDSTTTDITEAALLAQLQAIYDDGGRANWIAGGSTQKRKMSTFASTDIRFDRGERTRGQVVQFYESDFGVQSIVLDRWIRTEDLFIWDSEQPTLETLVGGQLQFERLGKTGDAEKGQVVCEKTLRFRREKHSAMFTALT